MSTPREVLAEQIRTDHPEFTVKAFPAGAPSNLGVGKVQVAVFTERLEPDQNNLLTDLTIEMLMNTPLSDDSETLLQNNLNGILLSVERIPGLLWKTADRAQFDEAGSFSGFRITLTCNSPNVYKSIVREEQKAAQ